MATAVAERAAGNASALEQRGEGSQHGGDPASAAHTELTGQAQGDQPEQVDVLHVYAVPLYRDQYVYLAAPKAGSPSLGGKGQEEEQQQEQQQEQEAAGDATEGPAGQQGAAGGAAGSGTGLSGQISASPAAGGGGADEVPGGEAGGSAGAGAKPAKKGFKAKIKGAVGKVTSTLQEWGQAPQGSFKWRVHHFVDKRLDAVPPSSRLVQSLPKGAREVVIHHPPELPSSQVHQQMCCMARRKGRTETAALASACVLLPVAFAVDIIVLPGPQVLTYLDMFQIWQHSRGAKGAARLKRLVKCYQGDVPWGECCKGGRSKAKKPAPQDSMQQQEGCQEGSKQQQQAAGQATDASSTQAAKEQQQGSGQGASPTAASGEASQPGQGSKGAGAEPAGPEPAGIAASSGDYAGPSSSTSAVLSAIRDEVMQGTAQASAANRSIAQPASPTSGITTGSSVLGAIAEQLQSKQQPDAGIEMAPASSRENQQQQDRAAPAAAAGASSSQAQQASEAGEQEGKASEPVLRYQEDGRLSEYVRVLCTSDDGVLGEAQVKALCAALGEPLLEVPLQRLRRRKLRKLKLLKD